MSYQYRKMGSTSSNTRDFGGSYYNSSNISNKSYISGTSNSISRPYESSYTSKYNAGKSYTRPNIESLPKTSYGSSGKYGMTDYSYEYKPIRKSMRELSNSPSLKYTTNRYNETSPYSTYSSRHGSNSYLSDKDSSKYIPSSISSRESVSFISPSNSYSINTRESGHQDVESKDQIMSPKQSSFISRYRRNVDDSEQDMASNSMLEKQDNESKCDMVSKTSRGTCTSANPLDDTDKDCSLISRTRVRKYPKQNVRIEMGSTVLVGNLSQIGKDVSTQTSDEIFLPSPRIRQVSYRSGSSKGSISTSYYSRGIDANKYSRPTRSNWRQHSVESPYSSIPKIDENVFFDSYSKPVLKEKQLSPKISHRKSTPISIKDSIEKVNEWQIQNQKLESENNSSRSPVPRSPNYHDLHAVTKPSYRKKSNAADIPVNDDKDYTDSSANIVAHANSPSDSKDKKKLYVTQYTDLDILLQNQFVINENSKKQGTPLKRDSYNSSFEDSPVLSNESTLIFSSKASKDIFNSMPIELQHIILKSKKRKLKFIDILDICRNGNHMKKFSDEEERSFKGYTNIMEMLIDLGIDMEKLENSVLQLCKFKDNQTEYGPFLDFDLTIQEQIDDLDGYLESGNNAVVLRTKLSIRVAALLDKISNASGKELRRALFSLKQIFQDDKDLVQEFVVRRGLQCLRQIGSKSDQNHQNYILRALGQLMLYVDGMNGVLKDFETIEWLYSLLQGKFRLVVKLSLKLLVVFIEYATDAELHSSVIISAIKRYHEISGGKPWSLVMKILSDEESNDAELVTYAITFVNKVLSSIPDQDTFYDVTDWLEEQGMEEITKSVLNKSSADVDMVKQFTIYENSLKTEDGEGLLVTNKEGIRSLPRAKSETKLDGPRKSKRTQISNHSKTDSYNSKCNSTQKIVIDDKRKKNEKHNQKIETASKQNGSNSSDIDQKNKNEITNQDFGENNMHTVTRRKYMTKEQRLERYKSLGNLYQEINFVNNFSKISSSPPSRPQSLLLEENENSIFLNNVLKPVKEKNYSTNSDSDENQTPIEKPEIRVVPDSQESLPRVISPNNSNSCQNQSPSNEDVFFPMNDSSKPNMEVTKQTVKAMKSQFSSKSKTSNDISKPHQIPTTTGIVSMAKDNLINAQNKPPFENRLAELKKESSNILSFPELPDWDLLLKECLKDSLKLKEWDFTDLTEVDDAVDSKENEKLTSLNGIPLPPPPPPSFSGIPPAPGLPKPPIVPTHSQNEMGKANLSGVVKQKRTTRLHWKILPISVSTGASPTIWSKLKPVTIESEKIESLFENKPHEFKKEMHEVGPKKLEVLDVKRSNAINIGMKNLVSIDCMKNAILNMTGSVINKEGVEKLLRTLLPSQEEIDNIKAAQSNNKDAQLGQAEKYLLDLHEINLLEPRLVVWLYQLEFDQIERDILESLMDLKLGIKEIYDSETLVNILSAILKLGNFLNETNVTAFSLEYLQKVPEVKDTKHKHSLLYHVVSLVCHQYPKSTDLHSDLSALNRCHRVDWDEIFRKLEKLKKDCDQVWHHLLLISKSDQSLPENIKKLKEFYSSALKRIITMKIIHKRVISRYDDVLRYLGFSTKEAKELNIQYFCKVLSDFAIEYRTTRERYYQLLEKKKKDKQREKTKGVMITDINSLDRYRKEKSQNENDLLNVIMSRNNLGNSDCDSDFNSLNNRRARRNSNQPPSDKNNNLTFPRPSSSYQMRNQDSSPNIANITPASSELALDSSDNLIDILAQQATSSGGKRRTTRRLTGTRERKSMRRTKPLKPEDINRNLDQMKIVSN